MTTFRRRLMTAMAVAAVILVATAGMLIGRQSTSNLLPNANRADDSSSATPDSPTSAPVGGTPSLTTTSGASEDGPSDDRPASETAHRTEDPDP